MRPRGCCGYRDTPDAVAVVLASLVDKSMVQAYDRDADDLPTAGDAPRVHDRDRRDEARELAHRHGDVDRGDLRAGCGWAARPGRAGGLDTRSTVVFDDLRLAVRNALRAGAPAPPIRIVVAAREYAFRRLRYELIGWAESTLAVPDANARLAAAASASSPTGASSAARRDAAIELAERARQRARRPARHVRGGGAAPSGTPASFRETWPPRSTALDDLVKGALASGDDARIAHAYYMRSLSETRNAASNPGLHYAQRATEAAARSQNPTAQAQAAYATGIWLTATAPTPARAELRQSETLARDVGNHWFELFARTETLWLQALDGEPLLALAGYADVLAAWHRAGDWANQWLSLRHVFGICCQIGADDLAMLIHGALEHARGAVDAFPFEPTRRGRPRAHRRRPTGPPRRPR